MCIRKTFLIILLTAAAAGYSQANPQTERGIQNPTAAAAQDDLIQLQVVVTDRAGKHVEGLLQTDFRLMEDGAQQTPVFFSMGKAVTRPGYPTAAMNEPVPTIPANAADSSSARVMILMVDTIHISANGLERVRMALSRFLDEQKAAQDLVAIMTTSGKPSTKGEFTSDRRILDEDLKKIRPGRARFESFLTPALCGKVIQGNPQALSLAAVIIDSEEKTSGSMMMPTTGNPQAEAAGKCRMLLLQAASERRSVLVPLGNAIERISALQGQRLIALFTEGFSMVAPGGEPATPDLYPVLSGAAQAGVMIYVFDATVAMSSKQVNVEAYSLSSQIQDSKRDCQHGMALLAGETGGDAFYNLDGIDVHLQKMLGDNRVYYRLAYYPSSGTKSKKYRSISVTVKDHPEYRVRAQKGYVPQTKRRSK